MIRTLPLLLILLLGCPQSPPAETSGGQVADHRPADLGIEAAQAERLRASIDRKLAVLSAAEGASVSGALRRLGAARELLDRLAAAPSSSRGPRDVERAALDAFARYLDLVIKAEPSSAPADDGPTPLLADAFAAAAAGDALGALDRGEQVLAEWSDQGLDSLDLRLLLADWALAAGEADVAAGHVETARAIASGFEGRLADVEDAHERVRVAEFGPEVVALDRARTLLGAGALADAFAELELLDATATTEAIVVAADGLRLVVLERSAAEAEDKLARAEVLLNGAPPFDLAGALLDEVSALPEGTFDDTELLRLRAWHRGITQEDGREQVEAEARGRQAALDSARGLVASMEYRQAIEAFAALDGTPLQATARAESARAVDALVKEERERAGLLFVAARKRATASERRAALEEVRAILAGLLTEFPRSGYADRVSDNLEAVERELARQAP